MKKLFLITFLIFNLTIYSQGSSFIKDYNTIYLIENTNEYNQQILKSTIIYNDSKNELYITTAGTDNEIIVQDVQFATDNKNKFTGKIGVSDAAGSFEEDYFMINLDITKTILIVCENNPEIDYIFNHKAFSKIYNQAIAYGMNEKGKFEKLWETDGSYLADYSIKYGNYFIEISEENMDNLKYNVKLIEEKEMKGKFHQSFSGNDDKNKKIYLQVYTNKIVTVVDDTMMYIYKNKNEQ